MTNPAYPSNIILTQRGETIRDKDARAAMQALIIAGWKVCDVAKEAFWLADMMEEERNLPNQVNNDSP
jgi:hypothetical protein